MRFFTSDTHFGHKGVIDFCERPFLDVDHMNRELVRRWNAVVKTGDVVYHLGDFSFMGAQRTREIVGQLNGIVILVRGNHDQRPERFFQSVQSNGWEIIGNEAVKLSHYPYRGTPMKEDERDFSDRQISNNGEWLLHGHVHREWKVRDRMINVGVDVWDYTPVSSEQILQVMKAEDGRSQL